jgi:prepilin-type N-terminal cleavage/methylation domain-containing protein
MKLNKNIRKSRKGVTLIELSVVIAVILVLISVLFIGASYYRDAANDAACTVNQSSIRKAAESYMNIANVDSVSYTDLTNATGPFSGNAPSCPTTGNYSTNFATSGGVCTNSSCTVH